MCTDDIDNYSVFILMFCKFYLVNFVLRRVSVSIKEVTESVISYRIEWRKRINCDLLILTHLLRIYRRLQNFGTKAWLLLL